MKTFILKVSVVAAMIMSAPTAMAQHGKIKPYSDCGIGAALFGDVHEVAAIVSNVIWDLGTTALTSATASPGTCAMSTVKAALFIHDSYDQIAEDAARGNGEHLQTALVMMECGVGRQTVAMRDIREGMANVVATPGYQNQQPIEKAGQMYDIIETAARNSCSA